MAPMPQTSQPQLPNDIGSLEPDGGIVPKDTVPMDTGPQQDNTGEPDMGPTPEEIKAHLDSLQDQDKAFLAEHLTPEFVRAIGLIAGNNVAQYLNQYADQDKVLVPVPRKVAEENLKQQQMAKGQSQPAPQSTPAPQPAASMPPQGGMMAPPQAATPRMS